MQVLFVPERLVHDIYLLILITVYDAFTHCTKLAKVVLTLPIHIIFHQLCQEWVVCSDCTPDEWRWAEEANGFGTTSDGTVLIQRNACGGLGIFNGIFDYMTFIFVAVFIAILSKLMRIREIRFDEDRLTADDYTVLVRNPPPDATDPDEWKNFFSMFAEKQVTLVTVALNNEVLLKKLVKRRRQVERLRTLLPVEVDMDDKNMVRAAVSKVIAERDNGSKGCFESLLRKCGLLVSAERLVDTITKLTEEIRELQKRQYNVAKVFVTFETEEGQREALKVLSGNSEKFRNRTPMFRGKTLLHVDRAPEPSNVRWLELSTTRLRTLLFMTINLFITFIVIGVAAFCENKTRREYGTEYAGPLVSGTSQECRKQTSFDDIFDFPGIYCSYLT